jgi:tRNA A-37 threonylcarbamoyl transferase component Bud32
VGESSKFSSLEGPERLLGTRVLEFELMSVLGAGGMSVVYRARHRVTQQEVAVKILPPELATHDELKARFVEEARVLARLEHPNITSLNNFCETGGRLCLIMQFVDGVTFEHKIVGGGKVPPMEVVKIGIEVCKALEYAHGQNVVHRDIKPSNVLIRSDGAVKVTDFGIAKIIGASRLTSTGQTMGTVRYMSPEQVRGKTVLAPSDIYSLGVTMYEGLAGRTPFEGETQFEIMQQHLSKKPPQLARFGVAVPPSLEKLLQTAMAKEPKDRFADATAMRAALEAELTLLDSFLPGALPKKKRGLPIALGAVVVLAVAGGGAWLAIKHARTTAQPTIADAGSAPPVVKKLTFLQPHALVGATFKLDQVYEADAIRVQSVAPRDALALRDRYLDVRKGLADFIAQSDLPAVRTVTLPAAPMTITLVPQNVLDDAELFPGVDITPGDPSRYMAPTRTLIIADIPGWEKELVYGAALHTFTPVRALTNQAVLTQAEKFEKFYSARRPK